LPARDIYYQHIEQVPSLSPIEVHARSAYVTADYEYGITRLRLTGPQHIYLPAELRGEEYDAVICHHESWYTVRSCDFE
jgi:hypothetical protein